MFFLLAAGNLNICLHEVRYLLLQPNTDWDLKFCFLYVPFAFAFDFFCFSLFFLHFFCFFLGHFLAFFFAFFFAFFLLFDLFFFFWLLFCFAFFHIFCGKNIPWFYRIWLEAVNITIEYITNRLVVFLFTLTHYVHMIYIFDIITLNIH